MGDVEHGGAGGVSVIGDDVAERARRIGELADGLSVELRSVSGDVDRLLASWHGAAADAYEVAWTEVHTGARHLLDALGDAAERVGLAVTGYRDTEAENRIRLDGRA